LIHCERDRAVKESRIEKTTKNKQRHETTIGLAEDERCHSGLDRKSTNSTTQQQKSVTIHATLLRPCPERRASDSGYDGILSTHARRGMHRLELTMETYDDLARKIRPPSPKTVAGRPGSAGEENNGAQLRKLRLRDSRKGLDPDPLVLRPCKEHPKLESGSSASRERKTKPAGSRNRKLASGAKCWDCEQGGAAEFGGSGNLCNPRPVRMPCLHKFSA
jgi:hypothetical protein